MSLLTFKITEIFWVFLVWQLMYTDVCPKIESINNFRNLLIFSYKKINKIDRLQIKWALAVNLMMDYNTEPSKDLKMCQSVAIQRWVY